MNSERKTVLVTGSEGFIGSHLVEALVRSGATVRAMVQYNSFNSWGNLELLPSDVKKSIEVVFGDVQDPYYMQKIVDGCDVVYHLAALIAIPYSYQAPQSYVSTNIGGTLNVLQACRNGSVGRVVHTSTSETYGTARYTPIDEQHPLQGQSPYSASKIGADKMAESYYLSFGVPVATIRPFNTYGPRQSARAIIPTVISQLLNKKNELRLGSLDPVRDFTFASDTARAFIDIANSDACLGQVVNVGYGEGISIGDVVHKIIKIMGLENKVTIIEDKQRTRPDKSEVMKLVCDNSKALKLCGWRPEVSLTSGLEYTIKYISENMNKFKAETYNI